MLILLFYVGDERYALLGRQVVEVISLVELKTLARSPNYVAGLLNYRGKIIPAIDLCQLIAERPYHPYLSTRMIVVNYSGDEQATYLLGLIAERVTDTLDIKESDVVDSGIQVDAAPYLGAIVTDERGMIQCIQVESLLTESQRKYLLPEPQSFT